MTARKDLAFLTQVTGSERGLSVGAGWLGGREKKNDEDLLLMSDT